VFTASIWAAFVASDADLVEINPVIVDDRGRFWAADAKVTVSDNALYRQHLLQETWLSEPGTSVERRARALGINTYLDLEGDTLLFCSGAGFSMCCFDAITRGGLRPANFLDIGGGASAEVMSNGLDIVLNDPDVRAVFVNVFGGITSCDAVAEGIVQAVEGLAARGTPVTKPIVCRIDGNNAVEGRRILTEFGHPLVEMVETMDDAARRAAQLAGGAS
jgi:succinyl-CoA synthetase beta subunit